MHPQITEIGHLIIFGIILIIVPTGHWFNKNRKIIILEGDIVVSPELSMKHLKYDKMVNPHAFYMFTKLIERDWDVMIQYHNLIAACNILNLKTRLDPVYQLSNQNLETQRISQQHPNLESCYIQLEQIGCPEIIGTRTCFHTSILEHVINVYQPMVLEMLVNYDQCRH